MVPCGVELSYHHIPHDSNQINQATVDLTDGTLTSLIGSPGLGRRILITWIAIYTIGGTATGLKVFSGTDKVAVIPTGTVGALPMLPTPIVLAENKALQIQLIDALSASVTVGYIVAPKG